MTDAAPEPSPPAGEPAGEPAVDAAGELTAAERLAIALGTAPPGTAQPAVAVPEETTAREHA
ncbi:hypothetical protein G5V58_17140 [Nocardioides anomalus]|uniref:Uncharacterized protein n=1 Tax=Nocardioides anomalus TaxID=2712223 RepID=A0A6G6WG14_9ACTN|nr:hypothetical protein [Nocardioides anomalus]QIG44268.1 hypothetical protein G5V58_17140 [Nocardioides anomalus]